MYSSSGLSTDVFPNKTNTNTPVSVKHDAFMHYDQNKGKQKGTLSENVNVTKIGENL